MANLKKSKKSVDVGNYLIDVYIDEKIFILKKITPLKASKKITTTLRYINLSLLNRWQQQDVT
jgi:hypothetical protein